MDSEIVIARIAHLPPGLVDGLVAESLEAGYRFLESLVGEWEDGSNRFDGPGEALFVAMHDAMAVGVCGLSDDPYLPGTSTGRLRRVYVAADFRRRGIGRRLVSTVVEAARPHFERLRLRTENPHAARLYEEFGFRPCSGVPHCTHVLEFDRRRPR